MDRSVSYSELCIEIKLRLRFAAAAASDIGFFIALNSVNRVTH